MSGRIKPGARAAQAIEKPLGSWVVINRGKHEGKRGRVDGFSLSGDYVVRLGPDGPSVTAPAKNLRSATPEEVDQFEGVTS